MIDHKPDQDAAADDRPRGNEKLDSWKEIAVFLGREVRTAQRWEKLEGLPVHRHHHDKLGTVYAYRSELEAWLRQREPANSAATEVAESRPAASIPRFKVAVVLPVLILMVIATGAGYLLVNRRVRRGPPPMRTAGNSEAVEAYQKGRYAWHKGTEAELERSLAFFQQARELDPEFSLAQAGIAEAYVSLGINGMRRPRDCFPIAEEAAERALALDESAADAHTAMAQIKCYWNWDWAGAEREFRRALDLARGLATAHHAYAHFLSEMGRQDEAIARVKRAQELEPLSAVINSDAGWFYFRARRYDEAIAECRRVLDMEPGFQSSEACILLSLIKKGTLEQARAEALQFLEAHGRAGQMPGLDAPDAAQAIRNLDLDSIEMMKKMRETRYVGSYGFASLYADLGDRDNAFKWLETAFQERERVMVVLNVHPLFDPIRDDPHFVDLVRRVGLPSNGRSRG